MKKAKDPARMNAAEQIALIKQRVGYVTLKKPPKYWLDTGSKRLNKVLGSPNLGLAYGKLVVLCGDFSSGKTLLATRILGIAQQQDKAAIGIVDVENSCDPRFAKRMGGLDFGEEISRGAYEKVALFRPEVGVFGKTKRQKKSEEIRLQTAEELFNIAEKWMLLQRQLHPQGKIALMVDSTTAVVPEEELVAGVDKQNMRTRLSLPVFLNMLLKRWQQIALNTNALIVLISQIRIDPTVMFGSPEKIPGGKGIVFYPAVVAQLRRAAKGGTIVDSEKNVIGLRSTIRNLKNKTGGASVEGYKCGMRAYLIKNKWKFLPVAMVEK